MRNRPRRAFAAPFILTIAAAIPGCKSSAPKDDTIVHRNPPEPDPDPDPVKGVAAYQSWTVQGNAGKCDAYFDVECPPPDEATCNPPPPMVVACPAELPDGEQMRVVQLEENGPCYAEAMECPEGGCDRTPTECPSWDSGEDM
jgi:hypothetical protein